MEHDYLQKLIVEARAVPDDTRIAVIADAIRAIMDNAQEGGSFRYFMYDRLGLPPAAYTPLYLAGGMSLTNSFALPPVGIGEQMPEALKTLKARAHAAPMEPHPELKRVDGTPFVLPSVERLELFAAYHLAKELAESNSQLREANARLTERLARLEGVGSHYPAQDGPERRPGNH